MFCTLFFSRLIRFHKVPHRSATNQHWPSLTSRKSRKDNRKHSRSISAWTGSDHWSDHSAVHKVPLLWCQVPSRHKLNVMWDLELEDVCLVFHRRNQIPSAPRLILILKPEWWRSIFSRSQPIWFIVNVRFSSFYCSTINLTLQLLCVFIVTTVEEMSHFEDTTWVESLLWWTF